MSNKLEGFVKDNKKEFEVKGPSDQLWERISAELDKKKQPKKSIKLYQWMSIAAVLVLGFGVYFSYNHQQITGQDHLAIADVNKKLGQKQVRFVNLIEEKKDSLQVVGKENPELYQKFVADMAKLDSDYKKLKEQLQTSPNPQIVVRAMMKNLEIQSNLLSQQLLIINQVNQYKKENSI